MEMIKWWKNKDFVKILLSALLAVILSAIAGFLLLPGTWGIITILAICVLCCIPISKTMYKVLGGK